MNPLETQPGSMRVLFVDPNALMDAGKTDANWTTAGDLPTDPAREVFLKALDPARVRALDKLVAGAGVTHVVIASHWRLAWSVVEIAQMLRDRGLVSIRKFSGVRVAPNTSPLLGIDAWLEEWAEELDSFAVIGDGDATSEAVAPFSVAVDEMHRAHAILTGMRS